MGLRLILRPKLAWLAAPWAQPSVFLPVVVAFAVPALFLASAQRLEHAVSDAVASQVVQDVTSADLALAVEAAGELVPDRVERLDRALESRFTDLPAFIGSTRTTFTPSGSARSLVNGEPTNPISLPARLFAREGATESLDVIERDDNYQGVFVSQEFATRGELSPGSDLEITVGAARVILPVQGVYQNLWPQPPSYWEDLPFTLVPSWDPSAGRPTYEALIVDEELVLGLGVRGNLRWDAHTTAPTTLAALQETAETYERFEEDLVARDANLVATWRAFVGVSGSRPRVRTGMDEALDQTKAALRSIDNPLASAQVAGVTLGLFAVAANASFIALRRRNEWRVLVADGDGPARLLGLAILEAFVPAALGAVGGVFASALVAPLLVPNSTVALGTVDLRPVAICTVAALAIAAAVTTTIATAASKSRGPQPVRTTRFAAQLLVPLVAVAVAGWIQLGSQTFRFSISPLVTLTPIAVLASAAGVSMLVLRALLNGASSTRFRRYLPLMLGLRRSAASSVAAMALVGALAVSIGLSIFAVAMTETRTASVEAKATTMVGAESSSRLVEAPPVGQLPANTTVLARANDVGLPGGFGLTVVALDASTFADVVGWPKEFGNPTPPDLVELLERQANTDIPAIALASRPVPTEGAFGIGTSFTYNIVASVKSAPLAPGTRAMLLVRADALEAQALELFTTGFVQEFGRQPTDSEISELHRSPVDGYELHLVSGLTAPELERVAIAQGLAAWEFTDRRDLLNAPEGQAVRWSFRYLRFVGLVSLALSLFSVVLYARQRKANRQHTDRVSKLFGIDASVARRAAAIEYALLGLIAVLPAIVAAIAVGVRTGPVFERSPFPPALELSLPGRDIVVLGLVTLVAVLVIGVAVEQDSGTEATHG